MVSLKWIKSLTNFYWLETNPWQNYIQNSQDLFIVLEDYLLNTAKEFKYFDYGNELDKACFSHDAAYSDSKDLAKRTVSGKILKERAYDIARNCQYDEHQRALACMVYKVFDKKTRSGMSVNEQLAEELHKPVIKQFF